MKNIFKKYLAKLILVSLYYFIYGIENESIQINEFQKVKVSYINYSFSFQYIPKENEKLLYSDIILNIDNNLNYYDESYFKICLFEQRSNEQCILVNDSSSIYFNRSIIGNITNKYYIEFQFNKKFNVSFPSTYEILEFYFFFINHEIPLDINSNNYIFKFNEKYLLKRYSRDYIQFKIP